MNATFKQLTDFIVATGADQIKHSEKTYLAHAIGVHHDLKEWGCDEEMCRAGLFHSIYGTEEFQKFTLPLERREELRELIGERSERLAYLICAMNREVFDQTIFETEGPYNLVDRFTGETLRLSGAEFADLCTIRLCDWLEQAPRNQRWDHRRDAYRRMAARLGGIAQKSYDRVYALETL